MQRCVQSALTVITVALAMTFLFWWPLYGGAGFIGGDLYPYFFPQKAFFADCLKAGTFPLWNDLTGFGYPVLGESQTGAAYPFHLVLYLGFDLNTAYNAEHLLHYVICFVATWLFSRRLGFTNAGAYLTALVFTYGWFPPRACLEWAILTGAWLPVALWCVESFLQTRYWRYAIGLSVTMGLQLLAGHFHLAFITQLLVVTYAAFRLWSDPFPGLSWRGRPRPLVHFEGTIHTDEGVRATPQQDDSFQSRKWVALGLILAMTAGAGLAAIQLLPTWELKQRSTRVITGGDYDPAYGAIPPLYASQMIAPWCWYSPQRIVEENIVRTFAEFMAPWQWFGPEHDAVDTNREYDLDQAIQHCRFAALRAGTNKVEAHLYCGLVPIGLAFYAVIAWFRKRRAKAEDGSGHRGADAFIRLSSSGLDRTTSYWLIAGFLALIYATGLLLPIGRHLPGFSFFRGPGRYGIVTTLAVALFAGHVVSQLAILVPNRFTRVLLLALIFGSTFGDLWLVSRMVRYTEMVSPPRIAFREASEVRRRLLAESLPPRLLAPGANVGNLLGVSCVPWYLGIAPAEYVDPQFEMPHIPKPLENNRPTLCTPELLEWLSRSGVTHVLNFDPLDEASWQVELVWKGLDPFLNRVWGRQEAIYLYRFRSSQSQMNSDAFSGRVYVTDGNTRVTPTNWKEIPAGTRRYDLKSDQNEKTSLVVTELAYPGWTVQQGAKPLPAEKLGMFRSVELEEGNGEVVWTYQPYSVYYGAIISIATLILLASLAHMRFWHPKLVDRALSKLFNGP